MNRVGKANKQVFIVRKHDVRHASGRKKNKYKKGARWMPWHRKAKKDAAGCDKPRVGA